MESFEELEAWKLARQLKIELRDLINQFPGEEKYRLSDQLIRCSRSIGANIAEGLVDSITRTIQDFAAMQEAAFSKH